MISTIYIIILSYFVLGGVGFYFINRRKEKEVARKSWTKFIAYFFIIHILFFSIVIEPLVFQLLAAIIVSVAATELLQLFRHAQYSQKVFFILSVLMFAVLAFGFMVFSSFEKELILFAFLILSIFDAFSQISGQLWGKSKIAPKISPNKTVGGSVGGSIIAILSALLLTGLANKTWFETIIMAVGIVVFAFIGDILASLFKRKYGVKDYSKLIPGHGGFLDRFDSLIAGGAWVALFVYVLYYLN